MEENKGEYRKSHAMEGNNDGRKEREREMVR